MSKTQPAAPPSGEVNPQFWAGKRVLLTGHTGFKGSWLSIWLAGMGAQVFGFALAPEHPEDMFAALALPLMLGARLHHRLGDVRDLAALTQAVREARPEIIIHMAAQALVRRAYRTPVETFAVNAMGTVHVLEAARAHAGVTAIIVVTTDKVYENHGHDQAYGEDDRLGGHDPYSASKAMAELAASAWRRSFFQPGAPAIATARAGNVIGGGDWSEDRLIPDAMRAWRGGGELLIRNPLATRPWQHVIDPLRGYLVLAQALAAPGDIGGARYAQAWNFGPEPRSECAVQEVIGRLAAGVRAHGFDARWRVAGQQAQPHEAMALQLDCSKAHEELRWRPRLDLDTALALTAEWYQAQAGGASPGELFDLTRKQIGQAG